MNNKMSGETGEITPGYQKQTQYSQPPPPYNQAMIVYDHNHQGEIPPGYQQQTQCSQPPPPYGQASYDQAGYNQQLGYQGQHSTQTIVTSAADDYLATATPLLDDNMTRSFIATIFCCLPIGIFALMRSTKARKLYFRGDIAGAQKKAETSRILSNIAIGIGTPMHVIWVITLTIYYVGYTLY